MSKNEHFKNHIMIGLFLNDLKKRIQPSTQHHVSAKYDSNRWPLKHYPSLRVVISTHFFFTFYTLFRFSIIGSNELNNIEWKKINKVCMRCKNKCINSIIPSLNYKILLYCYNMWFKNLIFLAFPICKLLMTLNLIL